jgi:cyclophilin family peptidyl-prolyl cis-trans isomerase/HEAT repeat protein
MNKLIRFICVALFACALTARGQSISTRIGTTADRDLLTALVAAEDSRDSTVLPTDPRRRGLASGNSFIRAFTIRGLGRIERATLIPIIFAAFNDPAAEVRAAAADAVAQAATRGTSANARSLLMGKLEDERDATVRASLLEALGRLAQGSPDQVKATANLIAASIKSKSPVERRGAIRGIFFLSRKPEARSAGTIPTGVTDRVFTMLTEGTPVGYTAADRLNLATILVNAAALNDVRLLALFSHRDPYVRDRAVGALQRAADTATARSILARAMKDTAPIVRFRSVGIVARRFRGAEGCAQLIRLARDADMNVALAATDAVSGCGSDSTWTARFLDSLAGTLKADDRWHLPAHAFVSLAALDPVRAHARMPTFETAGNFFVRMYADSVARLMRDTAALYRLAKDPHPNVQSSAIAGLSALVGHAADSVYIAGLKSDDNQLLMAASGALKGTRDSSALIALVLAFNQRRNAKRQTGLDGFRALSERIVELGGPIKGDVVSTVFPKIPTPAFTDLAAIERTQATIEMADGAIIKMRFHPFDAPTNSARFIRLAKAGTFNGLTFHRVAPFFVVQGPSPNANEYSAPDAPFARDELGLENVRGSVGLSTRGRDTGDGQIYINTVDNTWLDHEYTVMATIVTGLEAFDRMQEGARIKRITLARFAQ